MVWALFNKGRIFEKMAQHPAILNISNIVLGERSAISSYAANTVLPGQGGQLPHLDYPYYRLFYKHAIQMEGKAGDVVVFAGAMQHCAMPNRSPSLRAGILQ